MNTRVPITTRAMQGVSGSNSTVPMASPVSAFEEGSANSAQDVARLRSKILERCPKFQDGSLAQFMQQAFQLDDLVRAYFYPKVVPDGIVAGADAGPAILVPFEQAHYAASQTYHSALLERAGGLDRALAFVAALLYPCGLFLNCHPAWRPPGAGGEIRHDRARDLSFMALSPALQTLRQSRSGIAQAIAIALGHCPQSSNCIGTAGELLSSMVAAVYMANLRVTALWNLQASNQLDRGTS